MKIYKLPALAESNPDGEYRLGPEEADTGSVYIVYGRLRPGQTGRRLSLPEGHEEIICVVKGQIKVTCGKKSFSVSAGEAFNPGRDGPVSLDNIGPCEAIYICARGSHAGTERITPPAEKPAPPPAPEHARARMEEQADDGFEITNDGVPLED